MTARIRRCVAAAALGLWAVGALAQMPAPPAPPPPGESDGKEAKRQAANETFERALAVHLEAEKGGPGAEDKLRRAAAGYRKVLALRPAAAAHYNLARAEEALGDLADAEASYRSAASAKSVDRAFYLEAWASFLERSGRGAEAEKAYEELLLLDPRHDRSFAHVRERLLRAGPSGSERLLDFLWKIVAAKQHDRAVELALEALERKAAPYREEELLTVVAAALVDRVQEPKALRGSEIDRRLAPLEQRPAIGRGVVELRRLYLTPGNYDQPFTWWSRADLDWAEHRGVSRRDTFRALMRALGDGYRFRGGTGIAAACYDAAVGLGDDPDPVALRRLATVYVETNQLDRLDALAAEYADPKGPFFAAKNRLYFEGQMEKVLLYHRTLGQIYGSLARAGKGSWGSTGNAASAMFQLDRAYNVASQLDRDAGKPKDGSATRVDADLAVLYAEGLEATGAGDRATKVRLDAAQTFVAAGDGRSAGKMLRGVDERKLTAPDARRFEEYRRVAPDPRALVPVAVPPGGAISPGTGATETPAGRGNEARIEYVGRPIEAGADRERRARGGQAGAAGAYAPAASGPHRLEVPANVLWFDSGVDLARGRAIRIRASGSWSNSGPPGVGPGGFAGYLYPGTILASAPLASLVGRVGESAFAVGSSFEGASPADGRLYLAINDTPDSFGDNQGALAVTIELP